ncbi:MAG: hypothetical protein IT208_17105 [Chthonomonadales bacterium]|nr:hypothetical protein [Chthonomonadales bacterium]
MRREIPAPVVIGILVVILGAIGLVVFRSFQGPPEGTGISDADLRKQVQYRQQHGMLPTGAPPPEGRPPARR